MTDSASIGADRPTVPADRRRRRRDRSGPRAATTRRTGTSRTSWSVITRRLQRTLRAAASRLEVCGPALVAVGDPGRRPRTIRRFGAYWFHDLIGVDDLEATRPASAVDTDVVRDRCHSTTPVRQIGEAPPFAGRAARTASRARGRIADDCLRRWTVEAHWPARRSVRSRLTGARPAGRITGESWVVSRHRAWSHDDPSSTAISRRHRPMSTD